MIMHIREVIKIKININVTIQSDIEILYTILILKPNWFGGLQDKGL